jgi:teichuronic acid biosynthesis glycosyltransferase TuaC
MRILAVTNALPTPESPASGAYVGQQIKGLQEIGLDVQIMFVNRAQRGMRAYLGLEREVSYSVAKFHPEIVHAMYGGVMADAVIRAVQDRPTVVSFCGSDLLGENFSGPIRKVFSKYGVRASHRAARRANGIVVKSKNLYDALPNNLDYLNVRIIPNGVDLNLFKPIDRSHCRDRLGWSKDQLHVLFPTNSGDPCKRLCLAQAAVDMMRQRGVPVEIHQLCGVPHNEVPIWLNASDTVLLTSLQEGSPNVVKEALACNVPIVSVDVGDVRERIEGVDGSYIVLPEPVDIAAKLQMVFTNRRRVAGRIKMKELSLERVALKLKDLYERVLEINRAGLTKCT